MNVSIGDFIFGKKERKAINKLMDSNSISEGKNLTEFEKMFANYIGTKYCVGVNSGTSALMLVLAALKYHSKFKLKENSNILTTPLTYIATSNAIVTTGFKPVYCDIKLDDFSLDPEKAKEVLEKTNVSAIMPVHLMGYPADMHAFNLIARKHKIPVIEDAAEAHGSIYNGKKTGALGFAGCFSFYLAHNIQVGEFGAITTSNKELALICRSMKGNGRRCFCTLQEVKEGKCFHKNTGFHPRYIHDFIGFNFKAMEYQPAIGKIQLKKIEEINRKRRANVKYLNDVLAPLEGKLKLPKYDKNISYLGYPLLVLDKKYSRNKIALALMKKGIEVRPIFNCIPTQQPAYAFLRKKYKGKLPNAEFVGNNGFYVGCHQFLKRTQLDFIAKELKKILR